MELNDKTTVWEKCKATAVLGGVLALGIAWGIAGTVWDLVTRPRHVWAGLKDGWNRGN